MSIALALVCSSAKAGTPEVKDAGDSKYVVSVGDVKLTVDASKGAKILSFKYKDSEVISQMQRPNAFGSTFWPSPQAAWNWPPIPEYDSRPYEVKLDGSSITLTSSLSQRFPYRVIKNIKPDAKDNSIVVTYTLKNESDKEQTVAPWEITRVPGEGLIFFDAPLDKITPANTPLLIDFKSQFGLAWYEYDTAEENRKINADGKGWYGYVNNGLLLVKKFDDLKAGQPAPGEAEIQIYVDRGKTFIELEAQGEYQTLKAGESLSWSVRWYLVPAKAAAYPSKTLAKQVKKIVK